MCARVHVQIQPTILRRLRSNPSPSYSVSVTQIIAMYSSMCVCVYVCVFKLNHNVVVLSLTVAHNLNLVA